MTVKQATTLIQLNVQGKKLAFEFDDGEHWFFNDYTINKIMKDF